MCNPYSKKEEEDMFYKLILWSLIKFRNECHICFKKVKNQGFIKITLKIDPLDSFKPKTSHVSSSNYV